MDNIRIHSMIKELQELGYTVNFNDSARIQPKKIKNKTNCIEEHLLKYGSITSLDAINLYNATRLSSNIHVLRHKRGYHIDSIPIEGASYVKYQLIREKVPPKSKDLFAKMRIKNG